MDDRSSCEVDRAHLVEPAALAPDPVRDRRVDQEGPQEREEDEGLEALPLGERPGDEGRRDDGKHHLEGHVGAGGDCRRVGDRVLADAVQADEVQPADDAPAVDVRAECEREAEEDPRDAHQGQDEDTVHDRAEHVLAAHQAAVEERETGRHQHDQRRRGQYPGGVAAVDRMSRQDHARPLSNPQHPGRQAAPDDRRVGMRFGEISSRRVNPGSRSGGARVAVQDGGPWRGPTRWRAATNVA